MADPGIIEAPGQTAGRWVRAALQQPAGQAGRLEAHWGTSHRAAGRRRARALALGDWYTFIQQIAQFTVQPVEAGTREKQ